MRRITALAVALAATAALALPSLASSADPEVGAAAAFNVPRAFSDLDQVAEDAGIDVLLPSKVGTGGIKPSRIKGSGGAGDNGYSLLLGIGKDCNGSNACFVAGFYGMRGEDIAYKTKVKLRGGRTGYFRAVTCGASCSPSAIQWKRGDVLYEIQYKGATEAREKKVMISLANQAIKAGPR